MQTPTHSAKQFVFPGQNTRFKQKLCVFENHITVHWWLLLVTKYPTNGKWVKSCDRFSTMRSSIQFNIARYTYYYIFVRKCWQTQQRPIYGDCYLFDIMIIMSVICNPISQQNVNIYSYIRSLRIQQWTEMYRIYENGWMSPSPWSMNVLNEEKILHSNGRSISSVIVSEWHG